MSSYAMSFIIAALALSLPSASYAVCPPNVINGKTVVMSAEECAAWTAAQPSVAQTAETAALSVATQGVQMVSRSTAALNGTYPVTPQAQTSIQAQQVSILVQGTFTNGQTTMPWPDIQGTYHVFPNTSSFTAFAKAYGAYVTQLQLGKAPHNPVTIP